MRCLRRLSVVVPEATHAETNRLRELKLFIRPFYGLDTPLPAHLKGNVEEFMRALHHRPQGYNRSQADILADPVAKKKLLETKDNILQPKNHEYDKQDAIHHVLHEALPSYSVCFRVLSELYNLSLKRKGVESLRVLDVGSGVGTALFAAHDALKEVSLDLHAVEPNYIMKEIGSTFTQKLGSTVYWRDTLEDYLASGTQFDVTVSSFVLGEIGRSKRNAQLNKLWDLTAPGGYLVLIDTGDKVGANRIQESRKYLLDNFPVSSSDAADVIAPCTHSRECPVLQGKTDNGRFRNFHCTFFQRIRLVSLPQKSALRLVPRSKSMDRSDERLFDYTYVILSKGRQEEADGVQVKSLHRIIRPPMKRGKHTILDVCSNKGELERHVVTKRKYGKDVYKLARKSHWGGLAPLSPHDME